MYSVIHKRIFTPLGHPNNTLGDVLRYFLLILNVKLKTVLLLFPSYLEGSMTDEIKLLMSLVPLRNYFTFKQQLRVWISGPSDVSFNKTQINQIASSVEYSLIHRQGRFCNTYRIEWFNLHRLFNNAVYPSYQTQSTLL